MKLCVAQTKPVKGDYQGNIANHKKLIDLAVSHSAETIIFPELSLTGYEPELAEQLATDKDDSRFDDFQQISDAKNVTIGVGAPLKAKEGNTISMILFHPHKARQVYSKKYLHSSEEPFFVSGKNSITVINDKPNIALAICYELSVPDHSANAYQNGAEIYIASVVESIKDIEKAHRNLSGIGNKYAMTVLMANCIGRSGAYSHITGLFNR